ncbi:uncharacterized protein FMAN_16199 [Fusarium mangiferae]|uniref:Uncharacterized protein n=1 Tax=Fusarium mangiferae TaxID=192010 RepID=A0A1L7TUF5_FUSMA|nr:uncharacterized protein FMAN_16199 [Fusarium mangiferae]CVL02184.1 uncharacterized protein FMAN_16199 [Fusarium mangiferae]
MAPPCLSRLLLIFLVGLTHVIAHPVNKDDSAVLGSVNVKGSPDLKWKPKGEKHDHRKTHVQHGNENSTTIVYQKITVTSDGKDVSKDKPGKNGNEESTKTEHPVEFSSKHDKNVGATHKDKDLKTHDHKKHKDENIKYKNKPKVKPDLFKPYRSSRTSANDNKKSESIRQWKDNSIDKIKNSQSYKEKEPQYKNSQSYKKFGEKQQTKPTDYEYVKPQRENRVKESARPMVDVDMFNKLKKPYDNIFAEGRRREKQKELKNKLPRNDKQEADKDGKPLRPDNDSAIQPEFKVSDVTEDQWLKLAEDKESMKMLAKAKKKYKKLLEEDNEEGEKEFKELLRQALVHSGKKAQEKDPNKASKPSPKSLKLSRYIKSLMEETLDKPHKAELAPIGEKGVETKKTIGKRCIMPWWVFIAVELAKKETMKKEKKKMEKKMEEKLGQFIKPPSDKFKPDSDNTTRSGLNDKKQDSKSKLQTENKESKKKPETKTNTASERPMPTRSSLFDNAVAIEINNFTSKESEDLARNLYKTAYRIQAHKIQKYLKSSKDKHSDRGEKSLAGRRPTVRPVLDVKTLTNTWRKIRRQRARERYLRMLLERHPKLKKKLREKYPNHPMLEDTSPRRKGSIIPT